MRLAGCDITLEFAVGALAPRSAPPARCLGPTRSAPTRFMGQLLAAETPTWRSKPGLFGRSLGNRSCQRREHRNASGRVWRHIFHGRMPPPPRRLPLRSDQRPLYIRVLKPIGTATSRIVCGRDDRATCGQSMARVRIAPLSRSLRPGISESSAGSHRFPNWP